MIKFRAIRCSKYLKIVRRVCCIINYYYIAMKSFKTIFLTIMLIICGGLPTFASDLRVYVNKNSTFKLFNKETDIVVKIKPSDDCPEYSFCYYRTVLGYLEEEVESIYDNDNFLFVAFNPFNNDILFVMSRELQDSSYSQEEIKKLVGDIKFSVSDFILNLKFGVKNKSIRQSYVEKSLGVKAVNGQIEDKVHGFTYTFTNGFMSDFVSESGYNFYALDAKELNPDLFELVQLQAKLYYESELSQIEYINGQFKYWYLIPIAYMRQASNYKYNFALLYSVLNEGIGMDEFSFLVPEAKIVSSMANYVIMRVGTNTFLFENKVLVKE